ncbi:outer membrane beta-barrel protein [Thioclava sp. 'Guangxiensis']|uniref:outer membrane protein n=1 Tax=Thioclava sp. 'Guangxiensis' TaxID=3149044 RepID=UPI00387838DA
MKYVIFGGAALALSSTVAFAGGYTTPVVEAAPVATAVVAPVADWSGAYVGGNVNYGSASIDATGDLGDLLEAFGADKTLAEPDGASAALRAGYDWQFGQTVLGLGGEYNFGKYKSGLANGYDAFVGEDVDFEIKNVAAIFARAGYAFNDKFMAYGLLGYSWGKLEASVDGLGSEEEDLDGVTIGLGGEYLINDKWSAYGEYAYTDFGDIDNTEGNVEADLHQIKAGVNYRF